MRQKLFYTTPKTSRVPKRRMKVFKTLLKFSVGVFFVAAFTSLSIFAYFAKDLPDPRKINERQIIESTKIYDRTGQILLYDIHGEEKRTVVQFDQISTYLKEATVAIEDANFYHHFGLDFKGIARAIWGVITGNRAAGGGSTITQQFIKKSILTDTRSYSRKIKEAVLALELERRYSKDEILGFYLNQIPYGSNAYGVEAAAQTFFGKSAKDLDLAESAVLAALPNAPSRLSPYGSHPEELKARKDMVIDRMKDQGYITQDQAEAAKQEKLNFTPEENSSLRAPHFVMYIKEYLENKYGQDYVQNAGLKVYTTLDWDLQQAAEQIISTGAKNNQKKYNAANAALTAVDPKTGQILVMVGSADYFATSSLPVGCDPGKNCRFEPNVNVTIRDRQPGSSFKPLAYVTAFNKGFTSDTVLFDLKTEFNPNCDATGDQEKDQYGLNCYHPSNYDGNFRGPVTARQALAQSLNIPSVQMLYLAGIEDTIKTAKSMGITSLNASNYGLSLVLGGGEVRLLDEVAAYGVFATDGIKHQATPILKIEDSKGQMIEQFSDQPQLVLDPQKARLISDILSDNAARTPVFGASSSLSFLDRPVAAKTGTTQENRDAWTIGYTPSLSVGIWVGNNDNTPMSKAGAGISAAGPLWHAFFQKAYDLKSKNCLPDGNAFCLPNESEQFIKPDSVVTAKPMLNGSFVSPVTVKIDKISGQLATDQTPPDLIEEKVFNQIHNILYYIDKNNPLGEALKDPGIDPQFKNWEAVVADWLAQNNLTNQLPPSQSDNLHTDNNRPTIKILSPIDGQILNQSTFVFQVSASAPLGIKQIDYFLNDNFVGSSLKLPYSIKVFLTNDLLNSTSTNGIILKARAYDSAFNRQEDQITVFPPQSS